jgi:hypothetical protein
MKTIICYSLVLYFFSSLISSPDSNTAVIIKSSVNDYWKWEKQYIMEAESTKWLLKSETTTHFIFIKKERSENQLPNIMNKVSKVESNNITNPKCFYANSEFVINMNGFKADMMIISDILGRIHYSNTLKESENQFSINVNNYPVGAYFVLFAGKDNSQSVFKFVKY